MEQRTEREYREASADLGEMGDADLADYFDRLADDHYDSGTFCTSADYAEAAARIRNLAGLRFQNLTRGRS